jgi:hypothetical protein
MTLREVDTMIQVAAYWKWQKKSAQVAAEFVSLLVAVTCFLHW